MLFKSVLLAACGLAASVNSQQVSAADMVSNIKHLTDLTRIASFITEDRVYTNNPLVVRNVTVAIIDAIGTQAVLDQDLYTGQQCGSLVEREPNPIAGRAMVQRSTYTTEEQRNVTLAYNDLVSVSHDFMAACVKKHEAVVAHDAAHRMGQALNSTLGLLNTLTATMMSTVPAQSKAMTAQKTLLDQVWSSTVDLYVNGPL